MDQVYCPAYLLLCLLLMSTAAILYLALPSLRRLMLVSGLLSAPFALCSYFFVPDYWQPQRLMVFITGLEDLVFSFANGVIVFGLCAWTLPQEASLPESVRPKLSRYIFISLLSVPVVIGLTRMGMGIMVATILTGAIVWLICVISCRGRNGFLSLAGGISFAIFYILTLHLVFCCHPEMGSWWTARGLAGLWVWGLPLGEVLWALFFGATWPLFVGWTLGWKHRHFEKVGHGLPRFAGNLSPWRLELTQNPNDD
jgi:hypothetical protein